MARVWEGSSHGGTELLMLLAIADFSDDDGRAFPSVPKLAKKCRMKPRNANYVLASLQRSGELQVEPNKGPSGTNLYRLNFAAMGANPLQGSAPLQSVAPLQSIAQTPAKDCAAPLQPVADKPSINHQEPSNKTRAKRTPVMTVDQLVVDGLTEETAKEWLELRKSKRAPLTSKAWAGIKAEALKAGWTTEQTVCKCLARGWQGFEADWLKPNERGKASANRTSHTGFENIDYTAGVLPDGRLA